MRGASYFCGTCNRYDCAKAHGFPGARHWPQLEEGATFEPCEKDNADAHEAALHRRALDRGAPHECVCVRCLRDRLRGFTRRAETSTITDGAG